MTRYAAPDLVAYATALLAGAGLDGDKAAIVAEVLVEGDLLGHDTHGLAPLADYLGEIERGSMATDGGYEILSERPGVALWDGRRLPGPWLTWMACQAAAEKARIVGTGTVVIRRAHHIACLAAYLERVTAQSLVVVIESSDPSVAAVAPHGGTRATFTPNPIAVGIPTGAEPILIDVSTSISTMAMAKRLHQAGRRMPQAWLIDAEGNPTDDPGVLETEPAGTLLPLGGVDAGHKGFGLALMIEALTSGLGGYGRADGSAGWGASVFVQVLDPDAFGGLAAFAREVDHLAAACRANPPARAGEPVRLPGERGLARKREALASGLALHPGIMEALAPYGEKWRVAPPAPLTRAPA